MFVVRLHQGLVPLCECVRTIGLRQTLAVNMPHQQRIEVCICVCLCAVAPPSKLLPWPFTNLRGRNLSAATFAFAQLSACGV